MNLSMLKTKKFWIITAVVLVVAWIGYGQYKKSTALPDYDTVTVARGDIAQTVEATGKIQSANDLQMRFETAGTLGEIKVQEGDVVKTGQMLASLRASELSAAVAQAQANLNQKIAGANDQERAYYKALADQALADLNKTRSDTANSISSYEAGVETAKNNMKLAEGGEDSRIVNQEYDDAVAVLQATLSKLDDGMTQADNILGIDNTLANDTFEANLSLLNSSKLNVANSAYYSARTARDSARAAIIALNTISVHSAVDSAVLWAEDALSKTSILLSGVADVLASTPPLGGLTQTELDAKKTIIAAMRTTISTQYTTMISESQALADAKNSYNTYLVAYNKAVNDLNNAKSTATSVVAIKEAMYNQALANYENKILPSREVDLAPLRAALSQAQANYGKAVLRAPIDGVISKVNKKVGELVSAADIAIEMITPHFEVEVDIPETDVSKLKLGDAVVITLDAFGDDTKFSGQVISIDPASTNIQDVVYYKVKVSLDDTDKPIKTGMTANVTVATEKRAGVLYVPSRAVRTNGEKYVKILTGKTVTDVPVTLGLKADDGKVEIVSGVNEGDIVIVGTK
ncbi:MAG: efflux RND transporter periplasmic adaptor subunit [Candidatus Magasanikbacteria bacterium]|jgi:HlyD family secretion protein